MKEKMVNIRLAMKAARVTQTELAKMLKVSPAAVNYVVSGKKSTPRIRQAISFAIGKPASELWPDKTLREEVRGKK